MNKINKLSFLHYASIRLIIIGVITLTTSSVHGQILGNYSSTNDNASFTIGSDFGLLLQYALKFTIPAGDDYSVTDLDLRLANAVVGGPIVVSIRNDDNASDVPGTLLVNFSNPTLADASATYTFTPASSTTLSAGTTYWILVDHLDNSSLFIWRINDPSVTPSGIATFINTYRSSDDGASYSAYPSDVPSFQLNGAILPVELMSFSATQKASNVSLEWQTATEENNEGFHIERSTDGKEWKSINFVEGHGTTQEEQDYTYTDEAPLAGTNYYRLKQVDFDGAFEYSDVVNVNYELGIKNDELEVFPNPVQDELNIVNGQGVATIYNVLGQPVRELIINNDQLTIDVSDLPKGQYILRIAQENGNVISQQFIK